MLAKLLECKVSKYFPDQTNHHRYHYYTTTGGENLYPVSISHNARDCMEDIGCEELYGNETVTVLGKTGSFTVNMYRTDDFF